MALPLEKIYLDRRAENDEVAQQVLRRLSHVPVEIIADKKSLIRKGFSGLDPLGAGKRKLFLTRFYGRRVKPCPGTSRHICCGYYVINAITNCPMDCSYCVLQGYLNNPFLTLYCNWDELFEEVDAFLSRNNRGIARLGTGELSDSLALDSIFPLSERLVLFFADNGRGVLELKTKSADVDHLLNLNHRGRTIVSWSINPSRTIREEERKTAPLEERLRAAGKCQARGYPLGFHFDPLIHQDGWKKDYQETVGEMFRSVDSKRIAWISLGGFRYPPQLKAIARERFPEARAFLGELFPGMDGKFRYLKEIRIEMYRKMLRWLKEGDPELFVYLCMETQEVWERVFGWAPKDSHHLRHLFEERLKSFGISA